MQIFPLEVSFRAAFTCLGPYIMRHYAGTISKKFEVARSIPPSDVLAFRSSIL